LSLSILERKESSSDINKAINASNSYFVFKGQTEPPGSTENSEISPNTSSFNPNDSHTQLSATTALFHDYHHRPYTITSTKAVVFEELPYTGPFSAVSHLVFTFVFCRQILFLCFLKSFLLLR
jgi:hypothetical protein